MPYLYVLRNKNKKYYTGITGLDVKKRLERHNRGDVYSTKFGRPWELIVVEKFINMRDARDRERQIKSWKGGNAFKKFVSKAAGSSNGRTTALGAVYLGSNPSPAALEKNKEKQI